MAKKSVYTILIPLMILVLTGCFRQASDPVEPVNEALVEEQLATTSPVVQATDSEDTESPDATDDGQLSVSTSTPVQRVATSTPIPTQSLATGTDIATDDSSGSVTGPVQMASPSPTFVTPGASSSDQSAISTATPLATEGSIEATPTDLANETEEALADGSCIHEVRSGDTLYRIALAYDLTVDDLVAANPGITPSFIVPGDELIIPDCETEDDGTEAGEETGGEDITTIGAVGEQIYVVVAGDTLGRIAQQFGVTQAAIIEANNLQNPDRLSIGQELLIPAPELP